MAEIGYRNMSVKGDGLRHITPEMVDCVEGQVKALLHENDPEQGDLDYDRDKRKGKYTFPQRGTHAHGIAIKTQPKWATAEDI